MKVTYTARRTGFDEGCAYAKPKFFSEPRRGVTEVVLDGDWPAVRSAYEALGVPVKRLGDNVIAQPAPSEASVGVPDGWHDLPWSKPREPGGATLRGVVKSIGKVAVNSAEARAIIKEHVSNG